MFDGSNISILIAFLAGIITFFASCFLPLVPIYLAYMTGVSCYESKLNQHNKKRVLVHSLIFVAGFIVVFVLLGLAATSLGKLLIEYKALIRRIGGIFFIIMGFIMLNLIPINFLYKEKKFSTNVFTKRFSKLNTFIIGIIFGFAWTPCIGPVLATILFWASQTDTMWKGVSMLFFYGLGLGLPFLITGVFFEMLTPKLSKASRFGQILRYIASAFIIFTGILLLFDKIEFISIQLLQFFHLNTFAV